MVGIILLGLQPVTRAAVFTTCYLHFSTTKTPLSRLLPLRCMSAVRRVNTQYTSVFERLTAHRAKISPFGVHREGESAG